MTPLDEMPDAAPARVHEVRAPAGQPEWARQLADLGFTPGEPVRVLRRGALGGDPLVVRVGASTFALRRAEAACVIVDRMEAVRPA